MPRRSERTITIGVGGLGEVDETTSRDLLEDFGEREEYKGATLQFVFLATDEYFTDSMSAVCDLAYKGNYAWKVVTDPESKKLKEIHDLFVAGQKGSTTQHPHTRFTQVLQGEPNPVFFVLYDEEDEQTVQMAWDAHQAGIKVLDLADGLKTMTFNGQAEPTTGDTEDDLDMATKELYNELLTGLAEGLETIAGDIREHLNGGAPEDVEDEEEVKPRRSRRSRTTAKDEEEDVEEEEEDVDDVEDEEDEDEDEEEEAPRRTRARKSTRKSTTTRRSSTRAPAAKKTRAASSNGRRTRGAAKRGGRTRSRA